MTGTLTDTLDQEHVLACILARERERMRCLRILSGLANFVRHHGADPTQLALLNKAAAEIEDGSEPAFASWRSRQEQQHHSQPLSKGTT